MRKAANNNTVSLWSWSDDILFSLNFMRTISLRCRCGSQIWNYRKVILREFYLISMSLVGDSCLLQWCCYVCQFSFEKFIYVCKFCGNQESSLKKNSNFIFLKEMGLIWSEIISVRIHRATFVNKPYIGSCTLTARYNTFFGRFGTGLA